MTIEEKLAFEPYRFKYVEGDRVILKSSEEIKQINSILFEASPEFDYGTTKWYVPIENVDTLQHLSFKIISQIAWHMGWPFYQVEQENKTTFYIAEFYLKKG